MTAPAADATCYRHPRRSTGVKCTRCERPICVDCMVEAPVGHHCPECVREARAATRRSGRAAWSPGASTYGTVVTGLIAVNVVVFLLDLADPTITERFADNAVAVAQGEYYRMITSAFLHSGVMHLALNMFGLLVFGSQVESALGRARFLTLYLAAAVGGSVFSILFGSPLRFSVGASGAVFGLFGAYFVIARSLGADTAGVAMLIAINLFIGATVPGIDNQAHVGGLVTGGALAFGYDLTGRWGGWRRSAAQAGLVVAVAGVLLVLTSVRIAQLQDFGA